MTGFSLKQRIGEIVAFMPAAGEVFKAYNIDFCCGGDRALSQAVEEQELNGREIIEKLNEAYSDAERNSYRTDFVNMSSENLIDYIVNKHHAYLKENLPSIEGYVTKILGVHGARHEELFRIHRLFSQLKTDLEQHLIKEETLLFPLIKHYEEKLPISFPHDMDKIMEDIENEHEGAGGILKELRRLSDGYKTPDDGCVTFRLTYEKLRELESDLFQHIHLENNILLERYCRKCAVAGVRSL